MTETKTKGKFLQILKRNGWGWLLAALILIVLCVQLVPVVKAGAPADAGQFMESWETFFNGFGITSFSLMGQAYSNFAGFLEMDKYMSSPAMTTITGIVTGLAHVLVVLYMLIAMIKEGVRGEIDTDMIYWFRIFAGTAVAFVLVTCISTVINGVYEVGNYLIETVQESTIKQYSEENFFDTAEKKAKLVKALEELPGFDGLEDLVEAGGSSSTSSDYYDLQSCSGMLKILSIAVYLPILISAFLTYSAVFEIKLRQIFAPIAVASISYEGARGSGVRFLKKLLGCFVKIAIYFLVAYLGYEIMTYFIGQFLNPPSTKAAKDVLVSQTTIYMVLAVMANIVSALAMLQMGSLADEVVGA